MTQTFNSLFSLCLKAVCAVGTVYCIFTQYWIGVLILVPVFFVDSFLSRFKSDTLSTFLKVFLVFQGLFIWYLSSHEFFHQSVRSIHGAIRDELAKTGMHGQSHPLIRPEETGPVLSAKAEEKKKAKDFKKTEKSASNLYSVKLSFPEQNLVNPASNTLISSVVGDLPQSNFPDLSYRTPEEVRRAHPIVFSELPEAGFSSDYKNPCWLHDASSAGSHGSAMVKTDKGEKGLSCLPYAYILGQPKCGTSDLFERMKKHDKIRMPNRKEVRWFTRGEFTTSKMSHEGDDSNEGGTMEGRRAEQLLGPTSSIFSFTSSFSDLTTELSSKRKRAEENRQTLITVDGGPHTFWWPTQSPDGSFLPNDIPAAQLLREIQPNAKFIITLSDPVKRMYSDYHFLEDNLKPVRPGEGSSKSADQFHERSALQVMQFNSCVKQYETDMQQNNADIVKAGKKSKTVGNLETDNLPLWFRAAQMCAHNRHAFGKGGWGRLSIGLYSLYLEKWLEHFTPEQFLVVRLEDYHADPQGHMKKIFDFLEVGEPEDWTEILSDMVYNEHFTSREPLREETETLLRDFYQPYNELLAKFLDNDAFKWDVVLDKNGQVTTLHDIQEEEAKHPKHPMMGKQRGFDPRMMGGQGGPGGGQGGQGGPPQGGNKWFDPHRMAGGIGAMQGRGGPGGPGGGFDPRMGPPPGMDDEMGGEGGPPPGFDPRMMGGGPGGGEGGFPPGFDPRMMQGGPGGQGGGGFDPRQFDHGHGHSMPQGGGRQQRGGPGGPGGGGDKNLRGHPEDRDPDYEPLKIELKPQSFSIEDLPYPEGRQISTFFDDDEPDLTDGRVAANQLCLASFGLDIPALKKILYEVGAPADLIGEDNMKRNAFHCLGLLYNMIDPHPNSQLFAHLMGKESWLTSHLNPPLPLKSASILSRDIINSLEGDIEVVAKWLLRAGVPVDGKDITGHTPLHIAAMGGLMSLCRILLENGANPNALDHEQRTPLHYAASLGHAEVAALMIEHKADPTIVDRFDFTPQDVFENPGPITAEDALQYLNIKQRPPKSIDRILNPELSFNDTKFGWAAGDGGWSTKRLEGFETDMSCDVDQYWADEITGDELFTKYLARNTPVLIRGLIDEWDASFEYEHDILVEDHGKLNVQVSDIPYSEKFGGTESMDMSLREYIKEMGEHKVVGGRHPWYVFRAHQVPQNSEARDSLVKFELCPTPEAIEQAFEQLPPNPQGMTGKKARTMFVNAQWALGCEGTGAPVHFHNTAWNALVYGAKKWFIYPPHNMVMSNKQIFEYVETDLKEYMNRGVKPLSCVQTAGDLMIIPESWAHGVLNLQDSVAVASESKQALFRLVPQSALFMHFPELHDSTTPHRRDRKHGGNRHH